MAACGEKYDVIIEEFEMSNLYDIDNYELPITKNMTAVSKSTFDNSIVGYGWKEVETHEINDDGSYAREDFWTDMDGGGPSKYEFLPDEVIKYFVNLANPSGDSFYKKVCSYNENVNIISFDGYPSMRIIHFSETKIKVVVRGGIRFDKEKNCLKNVFHYITLQRMSTEELEKVRAAHKYPNQ